jgi:hypothetical protein
MENDFPDKVSSTDPTQVSPTVKGDEKGPNAERSFDTYMNEPSKGVQETGNQAKGISPFELASQKPMQTQAPTMESIDSQMKSTSGILGDVQSQLNTKNLKLKQSQKYLLRNKLSEANAHIRTAASKVGVDVGEPPSMTTRQNPIKKYLAYVTDGQKQLQDAQNKLKELSTSGHHLSAGQMLLIQVKMNKAQQSLEYSSILLSKAVDDIKMLFNIQI